jgi:chemotaxis regulatin CheY-phosphate phosphatase CheZ
LSTPLAFAAQVQEVIMAFDFQSLFGSVVKAVITNPSVQQSGTSVLNGVADQLTKNANNPEAVKAIATGLQQNAPAIIGAIVKGTPAEGHVDPAIIQKATAAAGSGS